MSGGHYLNGNRRYLCFTDADEILDSEDGREAGVTVEARRDPDETRGGV